jgi:hypothetical protein
VQGLGAETEKRNGTGARKQLIKHSVQTNESVLKLESWIGK